MIGPALVLSVLVGLFHVSAYVFIRGRAGARLPLLIVAAVLGAWAGDTVGGRMAIDPLRIGEFHLLSASFVAWLGIGLVAVVSVLVPEGRPERRPEIVSTVVRRTGDAGLAGSMAARSRDDDPGNVGPAPTAAASTEPEPQAR